MPDAIDPIQKFTDALNVNSLRFALNSPGQWKAVAIAAADQSDSVRLRNTGPSSSIQQSHSSLEVSPSGISSFAIGRTDDEPIGDGEGNDRQGGNTKPGVRRMKYFGEEELEVGETEMPGGYDEHIQCGPDITAWFSYELSAHYQFIQQVKGKGWSSNLLAQLAFAKEYGRGLPYGLIDFLLPPCPLACSGTVSFCNECILPETLNNIMYGFTMSQLLSPSVICATAFKLGQEKSDGAGATSPEAMGNVLGGIVLGSQPGAGDQTIDEICELLDSPPINEKRSVAASNKNATIKSLVAAAPLPLHPRYPCPPCPRALNPSAGGFTVGHSKLRVPEGIGDLTNGLDDVRSWWAQYLQSLRIRIGGASVPAEGISLVRLEKKLESTPMKPR